jgi:hypothetical protein
VSRTWYERIRNDPRWKEYLAGWMAFPNPNGWDIERNAENREDERDQLEDAGKYSPDPVRYMLLIPLAKEDGRD